MCTVVTLLRPGHPWPLLLAANRDERVDRAWDKPAAWWPDRPGIVGGRDRDAGGTWMALGPAGVIACVLNRPGSLGPAAGKRSRGELPLLAAEAGDAAAAADRIARLDAGDWRSFNLIVADRRAVIFLRGEGTGHPEAMPLPPGLHMVTALDPDDPASPRTARHLPKFRAADIPDPETGDWTAWQTLLGDRTGGRGEALNVPWTSGFGTVCSSLIALGADGATTWRFSAGPPDRQPFRPVALPHACAGQPPQASPAPVGHGHPVPRLL